MDERRQPPGEGPRTRRRVMSPTGLLESQECVLSLLSPQGPTRELVLDRDLVSVGSAADNDLVLEDPEISRRHFTIRKGPAGYVLRDEGSTNGTSVNGATVRETALPPGAVIEAGSSRMVFSSRPRGPGAGSAATRFGSVLGRSATMRRLFGLLERIASSDLTLLLQGETGTGKDLFSRSIHERSRRSAGPFVVLDCSRVSSEFLDSELFGHRRGSFTGALEDRAGAFLQADGGTLFIDEVGELPPALQPKLLRALEARTVKPLGSDREMRADVRVISASNRDLAAMVISGTFREDLYHRLQGVKILLPPLRSRREDVPLLLEHFLEAHRQWNPGLSMGQGVIALLQAREWPGNVRELKAMVDRLVALSADGHITMEDVQAVDRLATGIGLEDGVLDTPPEEDPHPADTPGEPGSRTMEQIERLAVLEALRVTGGNQSEAARRLGISRSTLLRRMKSYDL